MLEEVKAFELGPNQKQWLSDLKKYPKRQYRNHLGFIDGDNIKACCLGQGLLTLKDLGVLSEDRIFIKPARGCAGKRIADIAEHDQTIYNANYLKRSFALLGLKDYQGFLKKPYQVDVPDTFPKIYKSLAEMNDGGISWQKIAEFIESDPTNVFVKSM